MGTRFCSRLPPEPQPERVVERLGDDQDGLDVRALRDGLPDEAQALGEEGLRAVALGKRFPSARTDWSRASSPELDARCERG